MVQYENNHWRPEIDLRVVLQMNFEIGL